MKGDKIPNQHHIARYCKPTQAPDGQIQATAFMLRVVDESLSVNWLEILSRTDREGEIAELRRIYSSKLSVGAHAQIAVLNVGEVYNKVLTESPDSRSLEILHDPLESRRSLRLTPLTTNTKYLLGKISTAKEVKRQDNCFPELLAAKQKDPIADTYERLPG